MYVAFDTSKYFVVFTTDKGLLTVSGCKKHKIGGMPILIIVLRQD